MASRNKDNKLKDERGIQYLIIENLIVFFVSIVEYWAVEISMCSPRIIIGRKIEYQIVSLAVILAINYLIRLLFRKKIYVIVSGIVSFLLCVPFPMLFFYAYRLHGTPFSFSDLKNTITTINVIDSYISEIFKFSIRHALWIAGFVVNLIVIILSERIIGFHSSNKKKILEGLAILLFSLYIVFAFCFFIPSSVITWNYMEGVYTYGYIPCLIRSSIAELKPVRKPAGYSNQSVQKIISDNTFVAEPQNNTPDIIVILNESFYDLNKCIDVKTTEDPLIYLNGLDNCFSGYAVVPNEGGGTNISEWELLTSNSAALLENNITPFQSLDFHNANSIVSVLKSRGYTTLAAHNCPGENYNRLVVYNELGFDIVKFEEDFDGLEGWGNRSGKPTDASSYDDIIDWYSEMGEAPRFVYFLTIQNHGTWNQNKYDQNPIRVLNDYGDYTNQLSEFESCIYYSDNSFSMLVDYFNSIDRDVVILMVGDHCPGILSEVMNDYYPEYDGDRDLNIRSVPYYIWTNNPEIMRSTLVDKDISLFYLVPTVFSLFDVPSSNYYRYLNYLKEEIPILTKYGKYYDANMNNYSFDSSSKYDCLINDYFLIEYANVHGDIMTQFYE